MVFSNQSITVNQFSHKKIYEVLGKELIAILGYGPQGSAQALNLRDQELNVIVGQKENTSLWSKAIEDGWKQGKTLLSYEEACQQATFLCYLFSDIQQMNFWPILCKSLTPNTTLLFADGFAIAFSKQTHIIPPKNIDVILVAPKGPGCNLRQFFVEGKGISASYAIHQNVSKRAKEKALAYGMAMGANSLVETTFEQEAYSDLFGERGVLLGALAALLEAQYDVLRKQGHSSTEAFVETVEELTESIIPLLAEEGMEGLCRHCSRTAQQGALDWLPRFKKALLPVFEELYESVSSGKEAEIVIAASQASDYHDRLNRELEKIGNQEMWQIGRELHSHKAFRN